ncbi:sensor histidine kinase [Actinoplanes derwentensis]|uniref:histidine kinase n=1 Tax=Actinoplanes derwentensis TaxID=113562 RepID=A0A1H2BAT4_9ACTN|nr:ATP-binding protein [Actinoplanes derwentensis]GID86480.1 two-component sensor histidine kinase [Actinoplanes derwentensis]SDT54916.1 Signal transduction histidine kinase [Actinoplanes derwentensis]
MTRRLLLTYVSFALLILVSLEVPLGYVYHRNEEQHAFAQLEHDAEVLAAFIDTALSRDDAEQVDLLAHESGQRLGGDVDVVDSRGELLSSTHPEKHPPGDLARAADIRTVLSGEGRISTRTAESGGVDVMSVAVPIHPGVSSLGAVRVSVPLDPVDSRIHRFWLILAGAGIAVLLAAALVAFWLARWISKPVRALELATRHLADGTLPPAAAPAGPPELRRLADTFYATANRIQALIRTQHAFIGHASHQLKTPLSALRLRMENLEDDISPAGAKNLQAALTEADRLGQMVETLLLMARSEQRELPLEEVDLPAAVAERVFLWSPLADDRRVGLSTSGPDGTWIRALPGGTDQILDNLIANALRVAPAGSTVTIGWAVRDDRVELHVVDEGPGLSPEERVRALDPFWRAPGAAKDGTGLGLSLVHKLAEAGGGDVALEAAPGGGVDAVVTFAGLGQHVQQAAGTRQ